MELGENVQAAIARATPYPEGRWLFIPVRSADEIRDIQRLLALRVEAKGLQGGSELLTKPQRLSHLRLRIAEASQQRISHEQTNSVCGAADLWTGRCAELDGKRFFWYHLGY